MGYRNTLLLGQKMKITTHTLFKNDERWLWYSVNSVINYVDKLLLWDTGSSDSSLKIARYLKDKYKNKISLREYGEVTSETFPKVRQEMLDQTDSDWFMVLDADEIYWQGTIRRLVDFIKKTDENIENIVVPTINLVGDLYHFQEKEAGRYQLGNLKGHYNLRFIKRSIKGLHSQGQHGVWGWADSEGKQIQERNKYKFIDAPYLHTTFLPRSEKRINDLKVPKRAKKLKYEIGNKFPLDFYYPEVFFEENPDFVPSPWSPMNSNFRARAIIETPLRKVKRRIIKNGVGY